MLSELQLNLRSSIRDAVRVIDSGARQVALVVNDSGQLIGLVTDGDVRRGLLKGLSLDDAVGTVMQSNFKWLPVGASRDRALALMRRDVLHQIPVLDDNGRLHDMHVLDELIAPPVLPNWVVLMAGGQGKRLRPATDTVPKPMLEVGGRPLLESVLELCVSGGFRRMFISVNYLAEQIEGYFGDGSAWGVEITYLKETKPLGTAGALALLPRDITHPIIVLNGDVLSRIDLASMLNFHMSSQARATVAVRIHQTQIPFGVVNIKGIHLTSIVEKPTLHHHVNAGIYVIEPSLVNYLEKGEKIDMPSLLSRLIEDEIRVATFPIHEYWIDVGDHKALKRAGKEWQ